MFIENYILKWIFFEMLIYRLAVMFDVASRKLK